MKKYLKFHPINKEYRFKFSVLKTMTYGGVLWGLYNPMHKGWAIKAEDEINIFPFWISSAQANKYAKLHWPSYSARKISPQDFRESLLPTLKRFNVVPTLFSHKGRRFQFSPHQMYHFFFHPSVLDVREA
ncbi:DUF2750 domain-containing protein [Acinetobacter shaoyimingii]|uniref:DUF2750 domain-containing protein n=1 Tax=Acinetobacter shaoyimingii TaxID=2715164 RepID=A0A6G8RV71_9GAMM|nr:DUF2750 domain-containing protein [Acinetobacter shaoyimingii]QIO05777.1 DUF2750 domain-containing protein [Acinetobacter shaoyimingii]